MKLLLKILTVFLVLSIGVSFLYFNNTGLTNQRTVHFYDQLKDTLNARGYKAKLLVISTKRFKWHNAIQVKLSGAASKSKHITGDALDFIVFDVNSDGTSDSKDVDLVYNILHKEIITNKGGIGTYKTEKSFLYKQMIHIDCREHKARGDEEERHTTITFMQLGRQNIAHQHLELYSTVVIWPYLTKVTAKPA